MILRKKNNIEISDEERNRIRKLAYSYGIDLAGVNIVRNSKLTWRGIIGCFSIFTPDTIYICHDQKCLRSLLPVISHELVHLKQYQSMGWKYIFLSLPLLRNWTIEKGAYTVEDNVHSLVTNYPNP